MYQQYDPGVLEEINDRADLLEYISQSMELTKRGSNYYAHCPMHVDKTPSLAVIPSTNSYHCFSCGRSGKMIRYLMDYEGLSFPRAVEKAAALTGTNMKSLCQSQTIAYLRMVKKAKQGSRSVTPHMILDASEYTKYKSESIPEWESEGISPKTLELFGVRSDSRQNRIIYPVYDINGNLINIKGRTRIANYKALHIPKYINYYPVGTMDYFQGLNITIPYVKKAGEIIIFESIKSVMKAWDWGYKNCASAEKHSLTDEQVKLVLKLGVDVVLAYDSDISYLSRDVYKNIAQLKNLTNVFIVTDCEGLLGGQSAKNAPVDLGLEIWQTLYSKKQKVV